MITGFDVLAALQLMYMWLDDLRDPAEYGCGAWTWVKTGEEAIDALRTGEVLAASLDHDLPGGISGYAVVNWMEDSGIWPERGVFVHSGNTVGRERMLQVIDKVYPGFVRHRRPFMTPKEQGFLTAWLVDNFEGL